MGTYKSLRVQGFIIDPESIGVSKEIKLGCHDGNLGELFLFAYNSELAYNWLIENWGKWNFWTNMPRKQSNAIFPYNSDLQNLFLK